jgi:hypothetical protein
MRAIPILLSLVDFVKQTAGELARIKPFHMRVIKG